MNKNPIGETSKIQDVTGFQAINNKPGDSCENEEDKEAFDDTKTLIPEVKSGEEGGELLSTPEQGESSAVKDVTTCRQDDIDNLCEDGKKDFEDGNKENPSAKGELFPDTSQGQLHLLTIEESQMPEKANTSSSKKHQTISLHLAKPKRNDSQTINQHADYAESEVINYKGKMLQFPPHIKLVKLLGEGASGKVFLGIYRDTRSYCAVKFTKPPRRNEGLIEMEIMRLLKHKHIARLYEGYLFEGEDHSLKIDLQSYKNSKNRVTAGYASGVYCLLVVEYCENGTLHSAMKEKLPATEIKRLIKEILLACVHMEDKHIVHFDWKLDNIMLDVNYAIKVIDFGLASSFTKDSYCSRSPTEVRRVGTVICMMILKHHLPQYSKVTSALIDLSFFRDKEKNVVQYKEVYDNIFKDVKYLLHNSNFPHKNELNVIKMMLDPNPEKRPTLTISLRMMEHGCDQLNRQIGDPNPALEESSADKGCRESTAIQDSHHDEGESHLVVGCDQLNRQIGDPNPALEESPADKGCRESTAIQDSHHDEGESHLVVDDKMKP